MAKTRAEPTRKTLALRGLAVILGAALALGLAWAQSRGSFGGRTTVYMDVNNVGGSLLSGADVKVRGVIVGRIARIERGPAGGVRLTVHLDPDQLIPAAVTARVLPATVFGTSFVDLRPDESLSNDSGRLQDGSVIAADTSEETLELQQALDDIDSLVKAIGPADLAAALGAASQALDGRGSQVAHTIDLANNYLTRLNPKLPLVAGNISRLASNLELIAEVAPDLLNAADGIGVTARTIASQRDLLRALIDQGTDLAVNADAFLLENRRDLIRFIDNSALLLNIVCATRRAGITEAIHTNTQLNVKLGSAIEHGYVNGVGNFLQLDQPPYYTANERPDFGTWTNVTCKY